MLRQSTFHEFSLRLRPQKVQTRDLASAFSSLYEKSQQFLKGRKTKRTTLKQFDFPWKDFIIALFSDTLHGRVPKKCWSCSQSFPVLFLKENYHYGLLCAPTMLLHHSSFLHRPLMSFSGTIAVTPSSQTRTCRGLQLSKRTPSLLSHLLPRHFNKFKNSSLLPNSDSSLKSIAHGLDLPLPYRNVFHFFFSHILLASLHQINQVQSIFSTSL